MTIDHEVIICYDTVIRHESDSALVMALVECDSLGNAYLAQIATLQGERIKANMATSVDPVGYGLRNAHGLKIRMDAIAQPTEDHVSILRMEHTHNDSIAQHHETASRTETTEEKKPPASPVGAFLLGLVTGATLMLSVIVTRHISG